MTDEFRDALQASIGTAYTIERELGGGGMSRVFLAEDTALSRKIVLKLLAPELAAGVSAERFKREIRLAARLQHPHIVPLHAAGEADGLPYYTMPFVAGESLRQRIARDGQLPLADAARILRHVAEALAFAHEQGVVHRDIKPENVLLTGEHALVADFGVAKAVSDSSTLQPDRATITVTTVGSTIGTPAYMAPEQVAGDPNADHRADIYAFGCLAYELITGTTPFHGRNAPQMFAAHLAELPRPVAAKRPDCPPRLAELIMQCLEKEPDKRPQSAREILARLDSVRTSRAQRAPAPGRSRRWIMWVSAIAGVIAAGYVATRWRNRSAPTGSGAAAAPPNAVAVLPFSNVGGDSAQEYLADGMTDELATELGKTAGVQIAARSMAYRYKGRRDVDARDAGRVLTVSYLVQGSVRRAGDRLRVSAQLTRASDSREVWQDSYDGDAKDVFAMQDTIVRRITAALAPRLTGAEVRVAAKPPSPDQAMQAMQAMQGTTNSEAYDVYLHGRFLLMSRRDLPHAAELFQQAIDTDTTFARAYAALAETLEYLPYFAGTPALSVRDRVVQAARHALVLDSTLAEAHVALGLAHLHQWEWSAAGNELERAIAIDPSDASAHTQYARYLQYMARPREALAEAERARQLDPYSAVVSAWILSSLSLLGRHAEAIAESKRALEIDSTNRPAMQMSVLAYLAAGRPADALRIAQVVGIEPPFGSQYLYALGKAGQRDAALRLTDELEARRPRPWFSEVEIASGYLGVGDTARALDALERATAAHEIWPTFTCLCDYSYDSLRGSQRFAALLRRIGLDERIYQSTSRCRGG